MQSQSTNPKPKPTRLLLALLLIVILAGGVIALAQIFINKNTAQPSAEATPTVAALVTPPRGQGLGGPEPPLAPAHTPDTQSPETPVSAALLSLQILDNEVVPAKDSYSLTTRLRLKGEKDLPRTTGRAPDNYKVGHKDDFNISDIQNRNYYTITATVRQVTDHAYWYVADRESFDQTALEELARAFEEKIYPTNRAVFGSEWTPGVDNDPRITVLFAPLRGAGGSFSAADEHTQAVNPYSNQREMIYIGVGAGWSGLEGTLAHEFQHMIHWNEHANQDIWLNEGAAVLAADINGYEVLGVDDSFLRSPNVQLNAWEASPGAARPNYGAAFLFLDYLMSHYGGEEMIRASIDAPQPGTGAIDAALAKLGYEDRFADVVGKWALANILDGQPGAGEEYTYPNRDVQASPDVTLDHYPNGYSGQVSQFGASYIELEAPEDGTSALHVDFSAQNETRLIPAPAHSGSAIWWSNRGDLSDSTMTRSFDLTGLESATLDCYLWFDIEPDFDYAYAQASTDGGATWDTLKGKYTTTANPNGTNYGNAYTGKSADMQGADPDGWVHETFDLTPYAGKETLVRFEYITDDGYNVLGLAVDDLSIPELDYRDDMEDDTGWEGNGFVRIANVLPQSYFLAAVRFGEDKVDVRPVEVSPSGEASFDIEGLGPNGPYNKAMLVVVGLTPHTLQHPTYEVSVRPK